LTVSVWIGDKFVRLAVLTAFVLAHLFCVCSSAMAALNPDKTSRYHAADEHACCKGSSEKPSEPAPPDHKHDPSCTHCGGASQLTTPEPAATAVQSAKPIAFDLLVPLVFDRLALDDFARFHSFSRFLGDLSPPPDLLRVKCCLQI